MTCTWPVDRTCLSDPEDEAGALRQQNHIDAAVSILWALTGRRYSLCEALVRPCPNPQAGTPSTGLDIPAVGFSPVLYDGRWINEWCGHGCGYGWDSSLAVSLPSAAAIVAVEVEGVAISPDSYNLTDGVLWRRGGSWPNQDLSVPLGMPGTWAVRYLRGVAPPAGAALMVGTLAKEFEAVCGGGKCRLPRRVQSVTRQGVSVTMYDPSEILMSGGTGISEIDLWIHAHNPHHLSQPSAVLSPDYLGGA